MLIGMSPPLIRFAILTLLFFLTFSWELLRLINLLHKQQLTSKWICLELTIIQYTKNESHRCSGIYTKYSPPPINAQPAHPRSLVSPRRGLSEAGGPDTHNNNKQQSRGPHLVTKIPTRWTHSVQCICCSHSLSCMTQF